MKRIKSKGGHTRKRFYEEMVEDEGGFCKICMKTPPDVYLEVDFKDKNHNNIARSNRQLLCRSDNRRKNGRGKQRPKAPLDQTVTDRPKPSSAEFQKNIIAFPKFRHWLYDMVRKHMRVPLPTVINSGAEVADISQITAKRYLERLWSEEGIYKKEFDSILEDYVVVFRNPESVGLSADLEGSV